ncbi:hypothetical protein COCON_G00203140 [Conger conger]|uniref:Mannose receptor C type 2 n=1 Tax=Conger conger TaxID=82655 RepID=A0A9Q1HP81_CONCO|nr:hypothetical protein COCON_G00203140 [Conger conger]
MQRNYGHNLSGKTWTGCLNFYRCTLYIFTLSVELLTTFSEPTDPGAFAFFSEEAQGCLGVEGTSLRLPGRCDQSAQQWKFGSRGRLFNLGSSLCLVQVPGNESGKPTLELFHCNQEPARSHASWHCKQVLESLSAHLALPTNSTLGPARAPTQAPRWRLYGDQQDLCTMAYHETYTIQGNSNGRPCHFPFLYDDRWFHGCSGVGREDGHLWCATTLDYDKDQRWGFCPVKTKNCETFWDIDTLTGTCYQFNFQSTLSWNEARISCQQQGADLLSITELHEQSYINGLLTGYSSTLWIGLNDLDINGGWQWADSAPVKFLHWEPDQPNHAEEENCGVIRTEAMGRWQNRDCSMALPYVCKRRPNATLDPFTTDSWVDDKQRDCGGGWLSFQAGCYRLTEERKDWADAQRTCQKMEANLVSIHTLPELEFVIKNLKRDVEELWIGLHDTKVDMSFEWADHTPVIFTYWHPFEPNNFQDAQEDCVTIWGPEGRWNDSPCNFTLPSVCKKQAQKTEGRTQDHGCKPGWKWHSPSCYWIGEDQVTFQEARKVCMSQQASLVTITNRFEQAFTSSLILGRVSDFFWTALQDLDSTGSFRWLSGDEVSYTNWNRDQPGFNKGGCVTLATGFSTGLWEVKDCGAAKAKYICRQNLDTSLSPVSPVLPPGPAPTPSLTGACPQGWRSSSSLRNCYKVFHFSQQNRKLDWLQAHLFCRKHGANLLSIGDFEEEQFVSQILHETFGESEDHEQHWFWIGLNRRNPDDKGSWKWSDGVGYSYHNFGRYFQGSDIRQCAVADLGTMQWMAMQCDSELDWICKIPRGAVKVKPDVTEEESSGREWVKFQEAEYKIFDHRATWNQAERICTWFQSFLVSVHSPEEHAFLTQSLQKVTNVEGHLWWVGLHTQENDGRFYWADDSVLNYVTWAAGKPRPGSRDRKCVYMTANKEEWGDQKCFSDLPYVCKRFSISSVNPPTRAPPPPAEGCPEGWAPFLRKCYKVYGHQDTKSVTWSGAKTLCASQGAGLALLTDPLQQAFLTTLLPNISSSLWIGLSDAERQFQWINKDPLTYSNWAPGEPAGRRDPLPAKPVNCVVMLHGNPRRNAGMWASRRCEVERHGVVCQKSKDQALPPSAAAFPPNASGPLEFGGVTYRLLTRPLDWTGAVHICDSLNATLASVQDPFQQAYLTLLLGSLRRQVWVGLYSSGARSYSWQGAGPVTYSSWWNGKPSLSTGCGYMMQTGEWAVKSCESKFDFSICQLNTAQASDHPWSFPGHCPRPLGGWSWVPFRNFCYSFRLVPAVRTLQQIHREANKTCTSVGAELLSIMDETENTFVWEHLQGYEDQAQGVWLGLTVNSRGGGLAWPDTWDKKEVEFTNWEVQDTNLSMLSANTCFWVQRSSGMWRPGPCTNRTQAVVCKTLQSTESSQAVVSTSEGFPVLVPVLVTIVFLLLVLLLAVILLVYRRGRGRSRGAFEGARYSRSKSAPEGQQEKNILVSDMELNEQAE